ncbi:MAG: glycosyltransferase [Planctomycetes bacterium]|nr:glycosyltransferase [Planctomycetota bacterium]
MKILLIGAGYPPEGRGGTEVHMQQLARALQQRGHAVRVLARMGRADLPDYAVERGAHAGIDVLRVNYMFRDAASLEWIWHNPNINRLVGEELDRDRPDLVHVHHVTCLSTSMLDEVRARGIALVMTLHDFWTVCPRGQRITPELEVCKTLDRERCAPCLSRLWPHFGVSADALRMADAAILQRLLACDALITPSAFHRERMLEAGLDPARTYVIEHGLDHALIPARTQHNFPPRRVGFIGSVIPSKGVHVLVEAMNLIGQPNVECRIHGEAVNHHGDTSYSQRLQVLARSDLPIQFAGPYSQAELPGILAELDVLVVPSLWWESFCLTIREAMLAGVPVVASDHGAMQEALQGTLPELLFRPGDAADLAAKLYALATNESLYRAAAALRDRVRTLDAMAADTEELYRRVLGAAPAKRVDVAALRARKCKGGTAPYATVFIPTWNGGAQFEGVLRKVLQQETDFDYEILIIDSGSRDGTLEFIRQFPNVRVINIPNTEFNHGLTRNRAVHEARGDIVALLTHDAEPLDSHWLQTLVDNFDDPDVAGAYCHQLPREDCNPFQRERLRGWTHGEGTAQRRRLRNRALWDSMHPYERYLLIAFDDVASCVRKSVMAEVPFEKRQFGEDVAWGRAAILAGHTLVMDPRSVVIHSHNKPIFYEFKRVYLDHQNLYDLVGLHCIPSLWLTAKFSVKATAHLALVVWRDPTPLLYRCSWLLRVPLYGFTQNLAQYLGARSVIKGRRGCWGWLDRWLRRGV